MDTDPSQSPEPQFTIKEMRPVIRGPGLWGPFYTALWVNSALLAALTYWPGGGGLPSLFPIALWTVGLAVAAALACANRVAVHDMLVGLTERERIYIGLFIAMIFVLPVFSSDHRVLPSRSLHILTHGFLFSAPVMMMLAVKAPLARRFLAWTLMGAWFDALAVQGGDVMLLAAFGVSWLAALALTHYVFTGDPHGLTGWWPLRQALRHALAAALPALVVGALVWWLWPAWSPIGDAAPGSPGARLAPAPRRLIDQIDTLDLAALIFRGGISLGITGLLFAFLLYLRRWILRRRAAVLEGDFLPDQVARLEFQAVPPKRPIPALGGPRGMVVALWQRWAAALDREGLGRHPGETAAQYATRLRDDATGLAPPEAMTEILERAHYGPDEPLEDDVNAMRQHVQEELSRLSLQSQSPLDPID